MHKKDNAHEDAIWCCTWSRIGEKINKPERENDRENSRWIEIPQKWQSNIKVVRIFVISILIIIYRDSVASSERFSDYVVTGGIDDLVKIWQVRDDKFELRHKLVGHSLGVVSLDVSSNGQC